MGKHRIETASGTPAQQRRQVGQESPLQPHGRPEPGANWKTAVTQQFFTLPYSPKPPMDSDRPGIPFPEELLEAGLNGAMTASRARNKEELTAYLRERHEQLSKGTTDLELIELTAAHFVRLEIDPEARKAMLEGLSQRLQLIPDFYKAFFDAPTLALAVYRLPWPQEQTAQRRSR